MIAAIAIIVFSAISLTAWAGLSVVFSEERLVAKRLTSLTSYESGQAVGAHPQLLPFRDRVLKPGLTRLLDEISHIAPNDYRKRTRQRLVLAGNPRGIDVDRFVIAKFLTAIGVAALLIGWAALRNVTGLAWLIALVLSVLSFWLPDLWLTMVIDGRQKKLRNELPDMLDMLVISVEAGLGFDQAVAKIVAATHGPLAEEFARALQEIQAGTERAVALRNLEERANIPELNAFITAMVQADVLGIPIGNVLRTQAGEMRLTRRQRAEEQAQKTPVKIVFPLILCILPATLIVVLGPAVVSIGGAFGTW